MSYSTTNRQLSGENHSQPFFLRIRDPFHTEFKLKKRIDTFNELKRLSSLNKPKKLTNLSSLSDEEIHWAITHEYCVQSGIPFKLFQHNVKIIPDIIYNHDSTEVVATPLYDELGWKYTRFGHYATTTMVGTAFLNPDKTVYQVKVYGKPNKSNRSGSYYAPKGCGDKIYLPDPDEETLQDLESRWNVPIPRDVFFWQWFISTNLPLIITEGGKKGLSSLGASYPTVALFGVSCGVPKGKNGKNRLHQVLRSLVKGRDVYLAFDKDKKESTREKVDYFTNRLAKAIRAEQTSTKKGGNVSIVDWDASLGKGLDDLIANAGQEVYRQAVESARQVNRPLVWRKLKRNNFLLNVNCFDNQRYLPHLGSLNIGDEVNLIGIKAPKGAGKTEAIANQIEPDLDKGKKVLVIVHREQLGKEIAERYGLAYRTDLPSTPEKDSLGYVLCIDSLHEYANPKFNPSDWAEYTVVIDEVEQVLWHAVTSDTCKKKRQIILTTLLKLIKVVGSTGGRIFISDADLSQKTINLFSEHMGKDFRPYIIENTYSTKKGNLYVYGEKDPSRLVSRALSAVKSGKKILLFTSGQKYSSTWGTTNLEKDFINALETEIPGIKKEILRIDAETVADPEHPAYGCMGNLNEILKRYTIAICSPTVETGVSITSEHFDEVFCIAYGVQTTDAVRQTLARDRSNIDRHIWISPRSTNTIAGGSFSPKEILTSQNKISTQILAAIQKAGHHFTDDNLSSLDNPLMRWWALKAAELNYGFVNYRDVILTSAEEEGYIIKPEESDPFSQISEVLPPDTIRSLAKATKKNSIQEYGQKVSDTPSPSPQLLEKLQNKNNKTSTERLIEERGRLEKLYTTENVTPDLVYKDDRGWYGKIQLHYDLTENRENLESKDAAIISKMIENNQGQAFRLDVNRAVNIHRVRALEKLKITQFFGTEKRFTNDDLIDWLNVIKDPGVILQIKQILGVTVSPNDTSPIAVAQRLLGLLGLRLTLLTQKRVNGKPIRIYRGCDTNPDNRKLVFAGWKVRDDQRENGGCHRGINNSINQNSPPGGCVTDQDELKQNVFNSSSLPVPEEEDLNDLAWLLEHTRSAEELAQFCNDWRGPKNILNRAAMKLSTEVRRRLKGWVRVLAERGIVFAEG